MKLRLFKTATRELVPRNYKHLPARTERKKIPPTPPEVGYAIVDGTVPAINMDTQVNEQKVFEREGQWIYGWKTRDLTPEEIEAKQPKQPNQSQLLAATRSDIASQLLALPPESLSKFATHWAGINVLLDVGALPAAYSTVLSIVTDTQEESDLQVYILQQFDNFLPPT